MVDLKNCRHLPLITCSVLLISLVFPGFAVAKSPTLLYSGEVVDERSKPIDGVFPMVFEFETKAKGKATWKENHYVAVIDGKYTLELGLEKRISKKFVDKDITLVVKLGDLGEIVRQPVRVELPTSIVSKENKVARSENHDEVIKQSEKAPKVIKSKSQEPSEGNIPKPANLAQQNKDSKPARDNSVPPGGEVSEVTFAQWSEGSAFAEDARHANDCDTLQGKSLEDLMGSGGGGDVSDKMISEHRLDQSAHHEKSKIGTGTTNLDRVGGTGGAKYYRRCPAGQVVIGIQGGSGALIDSIELICAPLE